MVRETLAATGKLARQTVRKLPGSRSLSRLLRREVAPLPEERLLHDCVGRVAIVGEFGCEGDARQRLATARHAAKVLVGNEVVERGSSVEVRTMVPDTSIDGDDPWLVGSASALARALNSRKDIEAHLDPDPIVVEVNGGSLMTHLQRSIGEAIAPEQLEAEDDRIVVVVANPFFVSQALPGIKYHNMKEGGVAVLDDIIVSHEAGNFLQLWAD